MKHEGKIKYTGDCLWFINTVVKHGWFVIRTLSTTFSVYSDNTESLLKEYIYVNEFTSKLKKKEHFIFMHSRSGYVYLRNNLAVNIYNVHV